MSADLLRRAADRLDALDKGATPSPWFNHLDDVQDNRMVLGYGQGRFLVAEWLEDADADLIATMRGTLKPLAAWLRREADAVVICEQTYPPATVHAEAEHAFAVARAVLGETR